MDKEEKLEAFLNKGKKILSESIAAGAAGYIAFLTGGAAGAIAGGVLAPIMSATLSDISNRILSEREEIRVGATTQYAINRIQGRINNGDKLREDNFFDSNGTQRSDAAEVFEGILIKAKNEHEENKIQYLGELYANIAFDNTVNKDFANQLLSIAERLTFQQLRIISLLHPDRKIANMRKEDYSNCKGMKRETLSTLLDIYELYRMSVVYLLRPKSSTPTTFLSYGDIEPANMHLNYMGKVLYDLMDLSRIPNQEIMEIAITLAQ